MTEGGTFRGLIAAFAVAAVAGCASGDSVERFLATPDKFVLYNRTQLATAAQENAKRLRELEMLMTTAETDPVGVLVSSASYRVEYAHMRKRGEQKQAVGRSRGAPDPQSQAVKRLIVGNNGLCVENPAGTFRVKCARIVTSGSCFFPIESLPPQRREFIRSNNFAVVRAISATRRTTAAGREAGRTRCVVKQSGSVGYLL